VIHQPGSARADDWLREDPHLVIWTLTPTEVASALRRLARERLIDEATAATAEARADELVPMSHVVVNVEAVKAQARRILRLHALRAADALQLGAAIEWAGGLAAGHVLHTLDARLAEAARREGFRVVTS
jgi:predicted nucleic acid-binding protein